jgi:hypothetical protein
VARKRVDHRLAVGGVVQQEDCVRATRFAIGREQRAQFAQQGVGRRKRVGRGACRADGGARAATGADILVDPDVIAVRRDRAGRAKIETARAASEF